jgi:hypothetical protein
VETGQQKQCTFSTQAILPDGNGGFVPCPELLMEQEAIRYLRLDIDNTPNPERTLTHYRNQGQLLAIKIGRKNKYRRQDLDAFLATKSECKKRRTH